ncbi:MAG: hypothetical protein AB7V13_25000 [Pseudorhodoplanes sp.]
MPPRGARPGFKRGRHSLPDWIASQVVRDHMGFPDKCMPLPPDADGAELARLCRKYTEARNVEKSELDLVITFQQFLNELLDRVDLNTL